ncbi:MAG TPA: 1-(5-phosphoribosyl)-5-[(5-phosphoribosylamino)methylideneamino]imidazole-4-carboxamide isomerase [Oscillospiraceae bacterium]|nr:1-(5-phosphoribosyl)-5-[(5-phosphoribosylamino)methylideneamino]imidazole-4-carboxamide isomerase [Oscillospiraceae bacterium]HPS35088.1 1-(5-phosphoribosyl)-5-[(5-phosphoribosylamino)methylideneamino]imidazole-4-carboxamide isomerase [Oscillospiraceae bacterium]
MKIFPAIDLSGQKVVRLVRGDYAKMTVYGEDPVKTALEFEAAGASYLHVVDLDGAKSGSRENFAVIEQILKSTKLSVEIGGGIRDMEAVSAYLNAGAMRVIIGTAAVRNPAFLAEALSKYGTKIAVGVDFKNGQTATDGWTKADGDAFEFCRKLADMGVGALICTDIAKDGMLEGPNQEMYRQLVQLKTEIIASGGVSGLEDLKILKQTGVGGAIVGKALYTGAVDLREALLLGGE